MNTQKGKVRMTLRVGATVNTAFRGMRGNLCRLSNEVKVP